MPRLLISAGSAADGDLTVARANSAGKLHVGRVCLLGGGKPCRGFSKRSITRFNGKNGGRMMRGGIKRTIGAGTCVCARAC